MSSRTRTYLQLLALLLLLIALVALTYALQPESALRETIHLSPTLFVPPGGAP